MKQVQLDGQAGESWFIDMGNNVQLFICFQLELLRWDGIAAASICCAFSVFSELLQCRHQITLVSRQRLHQPGSRLLQSLQREKGRWRHGQTNLGDKGAGEQGKIRGARVQR